MCRSRKWRKSGSEFYVEEFPRKGPVESLMWVRVGVGVKDRVRTK